MEQYYDPGVRILLIKRQTLWKWHYDDLVAPFWRLYWNSEPGATIRHQKQLVALTPDRIILVPPKTVIIQRLPKPPVKHFHAHFLTIAPFNRLHSKIYIFDAETDLPDAIKDLPVDNKDCLRDNLNPAVAVRGLINCLLAKIPAEELERLKISTRLAENTAFIEARMEHSPSNSEIARRMGASVCTMLRQYRRELGLTPQAYLRQKRIEKACALLHDPQRNIKQVAEETGFCDRYHFSRVFKKLQEVTPLQYRQQFR